jgi:hypothetical protein
VNIEIHSIKFGLSVPKTHCAGRLDTAFNPTHTHTHMRTHILLSFCISIDCACVVCLTFSKHVAKQTQLGVDCSIWRNRYGKIEGPVRERKELLIV